MREKGNPETNNFHPQLCINYDASIPHTFTAMSISQKLKFLIGKSRTKVL